MTIFRTKYYKLDIKNAWGAHTASDGGKFYIMYLITFGWNDVGISFYFMNIALLLSWITKKERQEGFRYRRRQEKEKKNNVH